MTAKKDKAFFRTDGDRFVGNGVSRGPWSEDACHGGPVTGLIARSVENIASDKQLTRLTVGFRRPIPISGFRVDAKVERSGRTATTATATLRNSEDRVCAIASSLHLTTHSFENLPSASIPHPSFEEAIPGDFPVMHAVHDLPFFGSGIDVAYPPGETSEPGPTTLWMHTLPILEDEESSPFQSLCPIADSGNGISRNTEFSETSCVNADLTIVVHRMPESAWLASEAISFWQPSGIGMSHAMLFDTLGAVGTALQTVIVRPIS